MHLHLSLFTGIVPRQWAAVRRKHHWGVAAWLAHSVCRVVGYRNFDNKATHGGGKSIRPGR